MQRSPILSGNFDYIDRNLRTAAWGNFGILFFLKKKIWLMSRSFNIQIIHLEIITHRQSTARSMLHDWEPNIYSPCWTNLVTKHFIIHVGPSFLFWLSACGAVQWVQPLSTAHVWGFLFFVFESKWKQGSLCHMKVDSLHNPAWKIYIFWFGGSSFRWWIKIKKSKFSAKQITSNKCISTCTFIMLEQNWWVKASCRKNANWGKKKQNCY